MLPCSFAWPRIIVQSNSSQDCFHTVGKRACTAVESKPRSQLEQQCPARCSGTRQSQRQTKHIKVTDGSKKTLNKPRHFCLHKAWCNNRTNTRQHECLLHSLTKQSWCFLFLMFDLNYFYTFSQYFSFILCDRIRRLPISWEHIRQYAELNKTNNVACNNCNEKHHVTYTYNKCTRVHM